MDEKKNPEKRLDAFEALVEANFGKDERKFTTVAAAVNEGIIQGIQAFVPNNRHEEGQRSVKERLNPSPNIQRRDQTEKPAEDQACKELKPRKAGIRPFTSCRAFTFCLLRVLLGTALGYILATLTRLCLSGG